MNKTVMLTGGGTAGHITPALSVARALHEKDNTLKLVYVIERGNPNENLIKQAGVHIEVVRIYAGKFRRYHGHGWRQFFDVKTVLLNARDLLYTVFGFFQCLGLMATYRPAVVFSKGGYVSVPVALSSFIMLRNLITHDSDSVPGLANRIAAVFAQKNAVGVDGVSYPYKQKKIVFTGVPVSSEYQTRAGQKMSKLKAAIDLPEKSMMLLIGGSTQGAKKLDDAIEKVVPKLLERHKNLYVIHVFGRLNEDSLTSRYQDVPEEVSNRLILKGFLNNQWEYAAAADVVVTRAGATALAEYGVLGKACVVIPAPQLTGGHQLKNAHALEQQEAVKVVQESEADRLGETVEYLLQHDDAREALGKKLRSITPSDADDKLASLIMDQL